MHSAAQSPIGPRRAYGAFSVNVSLWSPLCQRHCGRGVEGGVGEVDVFGVHALLAQAQALAKALEVDDLPLPQEADDVVHVRVVGQTEDVVIGDPGLLFCCAFVRTTFPNRWILSEEKHVFFLILCYNKRILENCQLV